MITFSIVTITYNAASVLAPTLDSVLMQNYPHVEHIIIDGASTDDTVAIAKAYQQRSDEAENEHIVRHTKRTWRWTLRRYEQGTTAGNRRLYCLSECWRPFPKADTLDKVVLAAVVGDGEELPAVLFGDTDIIDEKGNFLSHRRLSPSERLTWRSFRYGMLVCHQAFYARFRHRSFTLYDTTYRYSDKM